MKKNPKIVTTAVIEKNGLILIGKRKQGKRNVGDWEFPGGTLEEGETHEQCLKRELLEELGVVAEMGPLIGQSEHIYESGWTIRLLAYRTTVVSGDLKLRDYDEVRWIKPSDFRSYNFSPAAQVIAETLAREEDPG